MKPGRPPRVWQERGNHEAETDWYVDGRRSIGRLRADDDRAHQYGSLAIPESDGKGYRDGDELGGTDRQGWISDRGSDRENIRDFRQRRTVTRFARDGNGSRGPGRRS